MPRGNIVTVGSLHRLLKSGGSGTGPQYSQIGFLSGFGPSVPRQLDIPLPCSKTPVGPFPRFRAPVRYVSRSIPANDLEAIPLQSGRRRPDHCLPGIIRPELNRRTAVNQINIRSGRERDAFAGGELPGSRFHRKRHRHGIGYLPSGASATFTVTCTSSVPSAGQITSLSADSFTCAGVPSTGHSGGGIFLNSFLYQYQALLGMRK